MKAVRGPSETAGAHRQHPVLTAGGIRISEKEGALPFHRNRKFIDLFSFCSVLLLYVNLFDK